MSTSSPTVVPTRYLNVAEAFSSVIDGVTATFNLLQAAFQLAERAEAGQKITLDDLKKAGMF